MGFVRAVSSIVSVAQPHVAKFMDHQKELAAAQEENKKLHEEIKSLKTAALTLGICMAVFFVSSMVLLILFLSK
ncbi:MAG: hypothetical protein FWF00_06920 [Endomicrobia bacterium]|nr:hypothetical protein [Endomicrobiia bacterium]